MKKMTALFGLYLFMTILQLSCKPSHALITDIQFVSVTVKDRKEDERFNNFMAVSLFTKDVLFVVSYDKTLVTGTNAGGSNCYAFKHSTVLNNKLLAYSYSITFDRDFVLEADTIHAGQNLFALERVSKYIHTYQNNEVVESHAADQVFEFNDFFVKNSVFGTGIYKATFHCYSSDNLEFTKTIDVEFQLVQ